jgi:hypothetical protein
VIGLTKVADLDYAARGIRVNAIAPRAILTERLRVAGEQAQRAAVQAMPMQCVGRPFGDDQLSPRAIGRELREIDRTAKQWGLYRHSATENEEKVLFCEAACEEDADPWRRSPTTPAASMPCANRGSGDSPWSSRRGRECDADDRGPADPAAAALGRLSPPVSGAYAQVRET